VNLKGSHYENKKWRSEDLRYIKNNEGEDFKPAPNKKTE
jgi:hypothetical protein